jgi:MoaA/NifB/PqqE/SkfB family radical SAM enzyme
MQDASLAAKGRRQKDGSSGISVGDIMRAPSYLISGIKYHTAGRLHTPKPLYATLHLTHRCNSRCVMCSDWRMPVNHSELTLEQVRGIFSNRLFDSVRKIALSGGEPTLREELVEIADTLLECCPRVEQMALLTNGLEPQLVMEKAEGLLRLPKRGRPVEIQIQVSVDGYGDVHEKVRRVPRAFEKAVETLERLKKLRQETPFYLCITCVVQPLNIGSLVRLCEFGQSVGIPVNFVPVNIGTALVGCPADDTAAAGSALRMSGDQLEELEHLIESRLRPYLKPSNAPFWERYFKIVRGEERKLPCFLRHSFAGVDSDGSLYTCDRDTSMAIGDVLDFPADELWYSSRARDVRRTVEEQSCRHCTSCCDMAFSLKQEFFYYAGYLVRNKGRKILGA